MNNAYVVGLSNVINRLAQSEFDQNKEGCKSQTAELQGELLLLCSLASLDVHKG